MDFDLLDYVATILGATALVLALALPVRLERLGVRPARVVASAPVVPAARPPVAEPPTVDMGPYLDGYADGWADAAAGRPPSP